MKVIFIIALFFFFSILSFSTDKLPSIKDVCNSTENQIRDVELMKRNLKKEFKNIDDELEKFEILPKLTKDINEILQQQILQAKLYHYLDCPRFEK